MSHNTCELCPNLADYRTVKGEWFICRECITSGKANEVNA
jgi:hypothetical protein